MSVKNDPRSPSQLEQDTAEVLLWLKHNAGREVSYQDISDGVGIPRGGRLQKAVRQARVAADHLGHRLERFLPSQDPRRRGTSVTRFSLKGQGDEFGARDAMYSSRVAISAMDDMRRSCSYEAQNVNGIAPQAYQEMASAVDGCIQTVSGVGQLGQEVTRLQGANNDLSRRIAELEAQLAEASAPEGPYTVI
ncbi:hypothetical protein [Streptomyces sp. NPDC048057]|uniref:hypothetical protein n=1 Tax=Streptomyces sp. NPDC048057 TaxID=3155628 RepID=UPI0033D43069